MRITRSTFRGTVMATNCLGLMVGTTLFLLAAAADPAQTPTQTGTELPPMPKGFNLKAENIARGKFETVEYQSKTTGGKRAMVVYTPPGYSKDSQYPILYL